MTHMMKEQPDIFEGVAICTAGISITMNASFLSCYLQMFSVQHYFTNYELLAALHMQLLAAHTNICIFLENDHHLDVYINHACFQIKFMEYLLSDDRLLLSVINKLSETCKSHSGLKIFSDEIQI